MDIRSGLFKHESICNGDKKEDEITQGQSQTWKSEPCVGERPECESSKIQEC